MAKGRFAIDLIGQKFHKLTVVLKAESQISATGHTYAAWVCKCDCGKVVTVRGHKLKKGHTKSCGCLRKLVDNSRFLKRHKLPEGVSSCNALFGKYKRSAKLNGVEFSITRENFEQLTSSNCHYCGCKPSKSFKTRTSNGAYSYNGLDRKNSKGNYDLENIVPCCRTCNFAKRDLSYEEFISHIAKISKNLNLK